MTPYKIEGPAVISFSGGRTSGYMLARIVDAHGGTLPDDVIPIFANTGKEHERTLEFVQTCSEEISPVVWVERVDKKTDRVVSFDTASRHGEPFEKLVEERKYLPNIMARFCTVELKIKPMHRYIRALGWDAWINCVGIRADEPARIAKVRGRNFTPDETACLPLVDGGITKRQVLDAWERMPFDLDLPTTYDGDTLEGNCDLCFLKGMQKRIAILRDAPQKGVWWARLEEKVGGTFRNDQPNYRQLINIATQPTLNFDTEDIPDCACTD